MEADFNRKLAEKIANRVKRAYQEKIKNKIESEDISLKNALWSYYHEIVQQAEREAEDRGSDADHIFWAGSVAAKKYKKEIESFLSELGEKEDARFKKSKDLSTKAWIRNDKKIQKRVEINPHILPFIQTILNDKESFLTKKEAEEYPEEFRFVEVENGKGKLVKRPAILILVNDPYYQKRATELKITKHYARKLFYGFCKMEGSKKLKKVWGKGTLYAIGCYVPVSIEGNVQDVPKFFFKAELKNGLRDFSCL